MMGPVDFIICVIERLMRSSDKFSKPVASACTTPSADWWTFQRDARRTGYVRGGMGRNPQLFWQVPLVSGTTSLTPPVWGAIGSTFRIFIGSGYGDGRLFALPPGRPRRPLTWESGATFRVGDIPQVVTLTLTGSARFVEALMRAFPAAFPQ